MPCWNSNNGVQFNGSGPTTSNCSNRDRCRLQHFCGNCTLIGRALYALTFTVSPAVALDLAIPHRTIPGMGRLVHCPHHREAKVLPLTVNINSYYRNIRIILRVTRWIIIPRWRLRPACPPGTSINSCMQVSHLTRPCTKMCCVTNTLTVRYRWSRKYTRMLISPNFTITVPPVLASICIIPPKVHPPPQPTGIRPHSACVYIRIGKQKRRRSCWNWCGTYTIIISAMLLV